MKSEILINHFHLLIGLYPAELAVCVKWQLVYLKGILLNVKFLKQLSDKSFFKILKLELLFILQ